MLKRLTIFALLCALPASAWFDWSDEWSYVYIATVNYVDVSPDARDSAPEVTSAVPLPLSVTVKVSESDLWEIDVTEARLQYRKDDGSWVDVGPVYDDAAVALAFEEDQYVFGQGTVSSDLADVDPGDTVLLRLYIANDALGYENAALADDTGADGTNGWEDQWVVSVATDPDNELPVW